MSEFVFVSGNKNKVAQLNRYLEMEVEHQAVDLPEIQSLNLEEIVEQKVRAAYAVIQRPVLVEDVSLTFTHLQRLPGPLIKWFLEALGVQGVCDLIPAGANRSARAEVLYGYFDGSEMHTFHAEINGTIATEPRGENAFGWNSAFIPDGETKTWGEMTNAEQDKTFLRKIALEKFAAFLQ